MSTGLILLPMLTAKINQFFITQTINELKNYTFEKGIHNLWSDDLSWGRSVQTLTMTL